MNVLSIKRLIWLLIVALTLVSVARAETFRVDDIRVEGVQKVSAGTIFNYLPIKVGDTVDAQIIRNAVRVLFKTGFFRDIQIRREGQVMVVVVQERPAIASIEYTGNKELKDEDIEDLLSRNGFSTGKVFNQPLLDRVTQSIEDEYFSRGRYSARVETTITPMPDNRAGITLDIDEGRRAQIREIKIIGNQQYSDAQLRNQMSLDTSKWHSVITHDGRYSKAELTADVERINSFYLDRGYLEFKVVETDVSISANKQDLFVSIVVAEGSQYTVGKVGVEVVGDIARDDVAQLIMLEQGAVYSRQDLIAGQTAIEEMLADRGYAFANVNGIPEQRRDTAIVNFTFIVDPGPTVYIRRINIIGNEYTRDEVIRRELRQLEGAVYSLSKIRRSRERLAKLGFFRDVSIQTPRVSGVIDQVDMLVAVEERSTGNFNFGVGYSGSEKLLLQAEIARENLFGTGRELRFKVDHSALTKVYDVAYRNPYYTTHGVSREVFVAQRDVDATEVDSADYHEDTTSGGVRYRIPLTEYDSMALSAAVEDITLTSTVDTPIEFGDFIDNHSQSTTLLLSGSLVRDTRDNRLFPSKGFWNRATAEISFPGSDLEFYTVSARSVWYRPIGKNLTFGLNGQLGYGAGYGELDTLPFYKNFYAGGARSLRGYKARSLGPQSVGAGKQSLGGSKRVVFGGELKFPVPGLDDSRDKRLVLFFDGGQVYSKTESIDVSDFRFSTGLAFEWMSAIGPIAFSYAIPFNDSLEDNVEHFQFTLGGLFR
tara:strand:+ start:3980 stop:6277 length:2298 start_codon:yes stop_codon:yes gene_type:complete